MILAYKYGEYPQLETQKVNKHKKKPSSKRVDEPRITEAMRKMLLHAVWRSMQRIARVDASSIELFGGLSSYIAVVDGSGFVLCPNKPGTPECIDCSTTLLVELDAAHI